MTYIIVKTAVYDHGVMWIGEDLDEAKAEADYFAKDEYDDGHHEYEVRLFKSPKREGAGQKYYRDWGDQCEVVYTGKCDRFDRA